MLSKRYAGLLSLVLFSSGLGCEQVEKNSGSSESPSDGGRSPGQPDASAADGRAAVVPGDGAATLYDAATAPAHGLEVRPTNTTCLAPKRPRAPAPVKLTRVFDGVALRNPMMLAQAPGDRSQFFVAQRGGTLVSFPVATPTTASLRTVLTIPIPVNTDNEGGLLGFAFHPQFANNGRVYLTFTANSPSSPVNMRSVVAVMASKDGGQSFTADSYKELLTFDQPFTNHNGGGIAFGTDGFLYLGFGDGGSGGDPKNSGQDTSTHLGKILRLDVDNPSPGKDYGIPRGNPFASGGGEPTIFAYGFRNPFRFSVDRGTGDLWVGDVGQNAWEEVNAPIRAGGNYGWRLREATRCYNPSTNCPTAGLIDPIWEYGRSEGASITGGVVYRGKAMPEFVGAYVFGDYVSGTVWSLVPHPDSKPVVTAIDNGGGGNWVQFGEDADGEVYALSLSGRIYALGPAGAQVLSEFPPLLSATGCVDAADPKKPAPAMIPFAPSSPLWSDGAAKERHFALPQGTSINVLPDGDFDFPNGTVLMKTFLLGGRRVETRLLVRHDDGGWAGYSYEWNDQETDATLLASSKAKAVGSQTWYFPNRAECMRCHTEAANRALGLELGQLNGDFTYPSTNRTANQLRTLEHLGLFAGPLPAAAELAAYPDPQGAAPVEARARSYLHSNCSSCHRPNGAGGGGLDFRFATRLGDMFVCGAVPAAGTLGISDAKVLVPGDPTRSLVVQRAAATGAGRMPPLASSIVDTEGVELLSQWVRSIASCPGPSDGGGPN